MAEPVKVWNDNTYPFKQKFKDEFIEIPPKQFIEMGWDDAHEFLGQYYPMEVDGTGVQKPQSYKMLRIDGKPPYADEGMEVCAACGDRFASERDLNDHIDRHHLDDLEDQKVAQKRKARRAVKDGGTIGTN